jgi:hypothetical protein
MMLALPATYIYYTTTRNNQRSAPPCMWCWCTMHSLHTTARAGTRMVGAYYHGPRVLLLVYDGCGVLAAATCCYLSTLPTYHPSLDMDGWLWYCIPTYQYATTKEQRSASCWCGMLFGMYYLIPSFPSYGMMDVYVVVHVGMHRLRAATSPCLCKMPPSTCRRARGLPGSGVVLVLSHAPPATCSCSHSMRGW